MYMSMSVQKNVIETAKDLQTEFKLSDFEALTIATKIVQSELYEKAHVIVKNHPSALEAIGMALGFHPTQSYALHDIAEALQSVASSIDNLKPEE